LDKATTGDGLLTALEVLQVLAETGAELDELLVGITRYPQRIVNVRVPPGAQPLQADAVRAVQSDAETALCGRGRVVLRASGTEPVIRVTVEADAATLVEEWAGRLAEAVRAAAGPAG
jgi:phosphoglucosamine mutase